MIVDQTFPADAERVNSARARRCVHTQYVRRVIAQIQRSPWIQPKQKMAIVGSDPDRTKHLDQSLLLWASTTKMQ